eukprot:1140951-Pelagomonas_calceolata.AAC.2
MIDGSNPEGKLLPSTKRACCSMTSQGTLGPSPGCEAPHLPSLHRGEQSARQSALTSARATSDQHRSWMPATGPISTSCTAE